SVGRGQVEPPERALPRPEPPHRRDQREVGHRQAHHPRRPARAAGRGGLRGRHAGAAGGGNVGDRPGAPGRLLPRVPALSRSVSLRRLPPSRRAGMRGAPGRGRARRGARPPGVVPAALRGDQLAFLVQRSASREVTFAIIRANASSRSICCELEMQITTNRTSASSMAREPSASYCFLVFSPKRWLISRASSPTSSESRARLVSGEKYPSLY